MTIQFGADFFIFIMEENFRLLKHSLKNAIRKACQIVIDFIGYVMRLNQCLILRIIGGFVLI